MKKLLLASVALAIFALPATARQLTIEDVTMLSRVAAPAVSPDGHWLVWQQRETDIAKNKGRFDLWRLDLSTKGAKPEKLVADAAINETAPQFSADGKTVFFQSDQGGEDNVWSVAVTGGTPVQVTDLKGGLGGFKVAPTGDKLLIWADRLPGAPSSEPAMVKKAADAGNGRTYDQLFVRHWQAGPMARARNCSCCRWRAARRADTARRSRARWSAIPRPSRSAAARKCRGRPTARPCSSRCARPGGSNRCRPISTSSSAPADGSAAPTNLTDANDGMDNLPTASPDGKYLA